MSSCGRCPHPRDIQGADKNVICRFWAPYPSPDPLNLIAGEGELASLTGCLVILNTVAPVHLASPGGPLAHTCPLCRVFAEHRIQAGASASNPEGRPHSSEHPGQWAACRHQRLGLYTWLRQQQRLGWAAEDGNRERPLWVRAARCAGCGGVQVQTGQSPSAVSFGEEETYTGVYETSRMKLRVFLGP